MKKVAFLTEMGFTGSVPRSHPNMRTEFAWMHALNATHHPIYDFALVSNYDDVYIIFPKGKLNISAEASQISNAVNPVSELLQLPIVSTLKKANKNVHYVQEGATWWFNEYDIVDQLLFYNFLFECDSIRTHNEHDVLFYRGLFPEKPVAPIRTLMFDYAIRDVVPTKEGKCIIGGNFARWYGGFQSYIVAQEFQVPIWVQESHAKRTNEELIDGLSHLPRLMWNDWMIELSTYKYAVHLMPTVAAGTFSLNCAYWGIPCIGNELVDTQRILHPQLSVHVDDVDSARKLAIRLRNDEAFYSECSAAARNNYLAHYSSDTWLAAFETTHSLEITHI
jgi:hypothetical protein